MTREKSSRISVAGRILLVVGGALTALSALVVAYSFADSETGILCIPPYYGSIHDKTPVWVFYVLFLGPSILLSGILSLFSRKLGMAVLAISIPTICVLGVLADEENFLGDVFCEPIPHTIIDPASYVTDFSDDKSLLGAAHNVFVAKVVKVSGTKERGIGLETQFEVEVVTNIKGELSGTIILNQQGGIKDGVLHVVGEHDLSQDDIAVYLLQTGSTYLFATRYNEAENWYTLISHPNAKERLIDNDSIDISGLKEVAEGNKKVQNFRAAYLHEILLAVDVEKNNTRNSFESLTEERKQASRAAAGVR